MNARPQSPSASNPVEDGLVEKVARAIYGIEERWPNVAEEVRKTYRADARRAIAAHDSALQADVERLREMLDDAVATIAAVRATSVSDEWSASADHFHDVCGDTLKRIAALRQEEQA